jgi:hypothetical protein
VIHANSFTGVICVEVEEIEDRMLFGWNRRMIRLRLSPRRIVSRKRMVKMMKNEASVADEGSTLMLYSD